MPELDIREVSSFEEFSETWGAEGEDARLLWQLLGQLDTDEVLVRIPEWLAETKMAYGKGASPTEIVGRVDRETEKAIHLADSVKASAIARTAHSIHLLEANEGDPERNDWLDRRLAQHRRMFQDRYDEPGLADGWLPKSQIERVVRRGP